MRKTMVLLLCFLMALSVAGGCQRGVWAADSGVDYVIRVGHVLATDHPYTDGLNYFKKVLEEKTAGRVRVEVFPNSMLGNERDMIEGLQLGTLEMALVSTAPLSGFTSDFLVFDLPYIFTDTATARGCVDSEVGMGMLEDLASQGIKGLLYFENGFRSVTNSRRPIEHPEDLESIKIRTMENPIHMDSFSAMGADPTPMAFGELFTALQQKTIDGQENPLAIVDTSKFYEVQTYLSLTEHFYAPAPLLMALDYYNNLPEDVRNAVYEAAKEAQDYERGLLDEMNARLLTELAEKGVQINEIDKAEFRAAVQSVYDKFEGTGSDKIPAELIEKVQNFRP